MEHTEYRNRYQQWLDFEELEPDLRVELERIQNDEKEIYYSKYSKNHSQEQESGEIKEEVISK